jgi:uncharacterized membrane protein YeaQ/YmgE (transglycosylase-associated protein family)
MEYFVAVVAIGIVAGTLASIFVTSRSFDVVGDVVTGMLGALTISYLLPILGLSFGGGMMGAIILATIGSIATLGLLRGIKAAGAG